MSGFCSGLCNEISRCCYDFAHAPFTKKNLMIAGGVLLGLIVIIIIIVVASGSSKTKTTAMDLLKEYPLIDGANSLSNNLKMQLMDKLEDNGLTNNSLACASCQTDLDRLSIGHVATQVFSLTTDCSAQFKDAVSQTLEQIDVIKRLIASSDKHKMALVLESSDIPKYFKDKKLGVVLNVWGGHNIDGRLAVLRMYYDLGVRMMALVSADPETDTTCFPPWVSGGNLTDFGAKIVTEMNRLGMIIDLTGSPLELQKTVLSITKAEVVYSHSGSSLIQNNSLNVEDGILKKYKKMIGVVMVPFTPSQLSTKDTNVTDVAKHLDTLNLFLEDTSKLGIGSNFDNMTKTTKGLEDVSKFINLISHLRNRQNKKDEIEWTDSKLKELITSNFIRTFSNVEKVRDTKHQPDDAIIEEAAYNGSSCYSDFSIRYKVEPTVTTTKSPPTEASTKAPVVTLSPPTKIPA